jgi:hypothetical protein
MRPYLAASTEELVELATAQWEDASVLGHLLAETKCRKSKRAGMLGRDLEKRLAVLASQPRGSGSTRQEDGDAAAQLRSAKKRIAELERELADSHSTGRSQADSILAKWGLSPNCPPFVFEHAKRAWRKNLHPDSHADRSEADRRLLEKMFQDFEADLAWLEKNGWRGKA